LNAALKETLANLLPSHKIDAGLFVSRGMLPEELKTDIMTANSVKLLVAGQRGMGKTVELVRLHQLLQKTEDYIPIFLQFGAEENIADVNLIYTMAQALIATNHVPAKRGSVVDKWFEKEEVISSYTEGSGGESGIDANVYVVRAKFGINSKRQKVQNTTKTVIKQKKDLIAAFNELLRDFKKAAKKQPVFIVDDIDKIQNLASVEATFINSAQLIGNIEAPCVFTVPFTYATSSFIRLSSLPYESIHRVPAIAVLDIEGNICQEEAEFLLQLLKRRITVAGLEDAHLERIVQHSGGVIVDALRMTRGVLKHKWLQPSKKIEELIENEFQKIVDEYIYQIDKPTL
jgi:hypothetical protein